MIRMTKAEIAARFPNDEDLQYGFDGVDRDGRIWYGRGIRMSVGPPPATGEVRSPLDQLSPIRGSEQREGLNLYALDGPTTP